MSHGGLRADVMNNDGHTPLDLAARSTSFFSMLGLVATLAAFGAQSRPQRRDHVEQWSGRDIAKVIEKMSDSLAVVAVLIATAAFTAANNIPGSYEEGMAALQWKMLFKCFLVLDSFALVTSLLAVVLLVFGKASRSAGSWKSFAVALHCIWASLISILLAFYAALAAVTSTRAVYYIAYNVISVGFITMYIMVTSFIAPPVSKRTVWKVLWHTVLRHSALGRAHQAAVSSRRSLRTKPNSFRGDNSSSVCRFRQSLLLEHISRARGEAFRGTFTSTFLCPLLGAASKLVVLLGAKAPFFFSTMSLTTIFTI